MKITYRGADIIIQGKEPGSEFYNDHDACIFLNHLINFIYRTAEAESEKDSHEIISVLYREEASDLFDQIALTGFYGDEHLRKAKQNLTQKRGDN